MRTVSGSGVELAVTERGDPHAPTVVMIHGFPDTQAMWSPVAERLAQRFHAVTYDVRGAGASSAPKSQDGYRLELLMEDLAAVLDAVSPEQPAHLLAHDWGSIQGWEAVVTPALAARIASYTSISGPPLDHVALWLRRKVRARAFGVLARQALRSSYVGIFNLPFAPQVAGVFARTGATRGGFVTLLHREGIDTDDDWPGPTLAGDAARGMYLYRANVAPRMRAPRELHTEVPVQIVVPSGDPFVPASMLEGLERTSPRTWWREVPSTHWLPRADPDGVARWTTELIDHVRGGAPSRGLRRTRVGREAPDDGRVVVVTGGGSGIGRATALAFAARGATVAIGDVDVDAAGATARACADEGGDGHAYHLDVADVESFESFAKSVDADLGGADIVVNNAGIGMAGSFLSTTAEDWERILRINLEGVVHGCRLFATRLAARGEGGHIVNIASAAAFAPAPGLSAYGTTKAAVLQLSQAMRGELASKGIGVSAICPGLINTAIVTSTHYTGTSAEEEEALRRRAARAYRRRNLGPEAVAAAIVRAVEDNVAVVPVGAEAVALERLARFAPGVLERVGAVAGRRFR